MEKYDSLKLDRQLCFPLYAASREIIKKYRPYLEEMDLTYTQYITMMVLWEKNSVSVKELGDRLYLDSGTLSPVLKSLEAKRYITRKRCCDDERILTVTITPTGDGLKKKALDIPGRISEDTGLSAGETEQLRSLLNKLLGVAR